MKTDFWTSTEYSGFMVGLIRELRARGVEARQKFQITEASYRGARSTPARLFLRFRQYVAYPLQLVGSLLACRIRDTGYGIWDKAKSGRQSKSDNLSSVLCPLSSGDDVCVVSTNTFYAPLLATCLHPNVIHLVYDLFPEAMIHAGKWKEGSFKVRVVRWITRKTLQRAKCNVFLGQRLKDYVESIHGAVANPTIIAVGADQALFGQSPGQRSEDRSQRTEVRGQRTGVRGQRGQGQRTGAKREPPVSHIPDLGSRISNQRPEDRSQKTGGRGQGAGVRGYVHAALRQAQGNTESSATILYCGNLGNMHDTATLFAYWESVKTTHHSTTHLSRRINEKPEPPNHPPLNQQPTTPTFQFHCSGPKRAELGRVVAQLPDALSRQIHLGGGLSQAEWIAAMEAADVALVTMTPGSETVVMPSKTYSAMMAGQAILAIAPEASDLVDLIQAAECGWWVAPGDVDGLASAIAAIQNDPQGLLEKRERAYRYAHSHLGQDRLAEEWVHASRAMGS